jgi:hypothetical protein
MLLSFVGYDVTQNEIVHAANIESKIKIHGATIQDLALAVAKLYPHELQFWYKFNSTLSDLSTIVNTYHYPVGVEWQGLFDWPDDEDDDQDEYYDEDDDDAGHYSIITHIDTMQNEILIADPEKHYATGDRKFTILGFEHRWWISTKSPILALAISRKSTTIMPYYHHPKIRTFPTSSTSSRTAAINIFLQSSLKSDI